MTIYAYCLLRVLSQQDWPVLPGIGGHPVFPFRCGRYTMLLSHLERCFPFTARSIIEHGQVIARAFETYTVLPMRFGTFFQSEKQVEDLIRENQRELLETFCRLRGKAEMRLKLHFPEISGTVPVAKKPPQKSRLLQNHDTTERQEFADPKIQVLAERCATWLRETFRPLQDHVACRRLPSNELVVDCAHLIESRRVENYRQVCSLAADHVKDYALRMSGPWPPYHFLPTSMRLPAATLRPLRSQPVLVAR